MAFRTVALYEGQPIGIESIYTLFNGKQINIQGKVEDLRKLGKKKALFCPCGCGNNLILVAGDKKLREQHFRIQKTPNGRECTAAEEGLLSIHSKIALKCWFESKLESDQIKSRVPMNRIHDTERKFEYSFYDFKTRIGLCYWCDRANVESDKVNIIENLAGERHTLYITDIKNAGSNGQYPEFMNKIQEKQGYVLYLKLGKNECYEDAELIVKVYIQKISGEWTELQVASDKLDEYTVLSTGELKYQECLVTTLTKDVVEQYKADESRREEERKAKLGENQRQQKKVKEKHNML